ncbi:MAG: Helix-turn-helix domain, partial [Planctomycetota bacterium]
ERTRLARDLLAAGAGVAEAAAATGFRDPSYFARVFARRVGRPPSRVRHMR